MQDYILKKDFINFEPATLKDYTSFCNIGFGISKVFARPLGVALTSIFENNKDCHFIAHIFIEELNVEDLIRFKKLALKYNQKLIFYYVDPQAFANCRTTDLVWKATYYRLIGAGVLYGLVDYLFWIDSDTICCGSLKEIFNLELSNKIVAVVLHAKQKGMVDERIRVLKLKGKKYFNAGVILINVNNWKTFDANNKILSMVKNPDPSWIIYDQDMLNVLLDEQFECLPYTYNFQRLNGSPEYTEIPKDVRLYHYIGREKPWIEYESEFQEPWLKYWRQSFWNDVPLDKVEFKKGNATMFRLMSKADFKHGKVYAGLINYIKYLYLKLFA